MASCPLRRKSLICVSISAIKGDMTNTAEGEACCLKASQRWGSNSKIWRNWRNLSVHVSECDICFGNMYKEDSDGSICTCARNLALPLWSVRKIDDSTSKQILTWGCKTDGWRFQTVQLISLYCPFLTFPCSLNSFSCYFGQFMQAGRSLILSSALFLLILRLIERWRTDELIMMSIFLAELIDDNWLQDVSAT